MDQITQQTASGADKSASAAEELDGQAHKLQDMVASLMALVSARQAAAVGHGSRGAAGLLAAPAPAPPGPALAGLMPLARPPDLL